MLTLREFLLAQHVTVVMEASGVTEPWVQRPPTRTEDHRNATVLTHVGNWWRF
jgi:hypothetical protein